MPLGMRCERSGEIVDVTETIVETGMVLFYFSSLGGPGGGVLADGFCGRMLMWCGL